MLNSNLLQLMSALSPSEFRELGDYVRSPFFNKNESVIKVYDYIKLYHPEFSHINFEKEFVYRKLFPNVDYDDAFMRKLMFNLAKLAEDFLSYKNYTSDKFTYYKHLLTELDLKGLQKQFHKKLNLMEQEFDKLSIKDENYYITRNVIDKFHSYIVLKWSNFVNTKDKPDSVVIRETESHINIFLIKILAEYRFLFNFQKMMKFEFESEFHNDIISYLKKNEKLHDVPLLSLYFHSLLLLIEKDEKHFETVKKLLLDQMKTFSYHDKYSSFALLTNFTNDEYNNGNMKFLNERHELHKLILENNLLSGSGEDMHFNDVLFKNIVTVGLLLRETDWTEKFIKKYISRVDPDQKDNILNYNNARVNFAKGNLEKSLEDLSRITTVHHFHYKPSIKALTLMVFMEKGWADQSYDLIDTYRKFLSNDKMMPDFQKEKNANFLKFCNEILKIRSRNSKEKIADAKHELQGSGNVLEKEWLLEKFEEMEK